MSDTFMTKEEKAELSKAFRQATSAMDAVYGVINKIGDNHNREWEPKGDNRAVYEHVGDCAGEYMSDARIVELFSDPEDWNVFDGEPESEAEGDQRQDDPAKTSAHGRPGWQGGD